MLKKHLDIQSARELTGWAYGDMKWPSEAEAGEAETKRDQLLRSITGSTARPFGGNKITTGPLSPGCATCGQGTWSCIFIGSLCTARCFYCPQDRDCEEDQPPTESGLVFRDPDDYVDYLERLGFRGVGFSGGEPLLKLNEVLSFTRRIRQRLGRRIYIWVYTNGDLVDGESLKLLKEAGIDELRFDIAARGYDLKAVTQAVPVIDTVTVEIPAIPEDYRTLTKCLARMEAIGVSHLNLHQLHASQYCYRQFTDRGYTFLHQPDIAVLESEMTALRLVKYALDRNIRLPINYCSLISKHRLQGRGYRERLRRYIQEGCEGSTESGFIRRLSVQCGPAEMKKLLRLFRDKAFPGTLWFNEKGRSELLFHHSLLKSIDPIAYHLSVSYYAPYLTDTEGAGEEPLKELPLNGKRSLWIGRSLAYQRTLKNPSAIDGFRRLVIEKRKARDVLRRFYQTYELRTKADIDGMMNERDLLDLLGVWESIGIGLHDIY